MSAFNPKLPLGLTADTICMSGEWRDGHTTAAGAAFHVDYFPHDAADKQQHHKGNRPPLLHRGFFAVSALQCNVRFPPIAVISVLGKRLVMRGFSLTLASALAMMPGATSSLANPPSETAETTVTIPSQFQGVWDADAAACAAVASDMRQYIGSDGIRFGDAVGKVRRVIRRNSQSVSVLTSFVSDGDPWEGEVRLTLSPSGNELTVQTGENSSIRKRCPLSS